MTDCNSFTLSLSLSGLRESRCIDRPSTVPRSNLIFLLFTVCFDYLIFFYSSFAFYFTIYTYCVDNGYSTKLKNFVHDSQFLNKNLFPTHYAENTISFKYLIP